MRSRVSAIATLLLSLSAMGTASAHTITIDGLDDEWLARQPNAPDLGMVVRGPKGRGELVWRDASSDARTSLSNPELEADMKAFRVTGDATNLYFFVALPNTHSTTPVQVQIAIDLGVAGAISNFLSGTETQLAVGTSANFVVRSTFANPFVANASAQVSNKDQTVLASVPTQFGADGVEISVPWTLFGLAGPPTKPIRFSAATFRAASATTTVEVTGSDALDVLSDYGDPRGPVQGPGTDAELADDNRVDDFIEAYFAADGEVYSPVLISRFVSNGSPATARHWVALQNMTGGALSSSSFKLGDSEVPDDNEGMLSLPLGSIASKAEYVVATHGTEYEAYFGKAPNAETTGNSASVPDAIPFAPWAGGGLLFVTLGDELVLLDGTNTLLDVVTYGTGSYAGITAFTPAPALDIVVGRDLNLTDTDDCSSDFAALGPECVSSDTCGPCKVCSKNACVATAAGSSCADGDVCNGGETCDGKGACDKGTAPNCSDKNLCTTDVCHPVKGCGHTAESAGKACNDGNTCTVSDACNGAGTCTGSQVDCTPPAPSCVSGTSLKYTGGTCYLGECSFTEEKTNCANGCDAVSGLCKGDPCEGLDCDTPPSQCHFFSGLCKQGLCNFDAKEVGTPCDDNDPCTALDACNLAQLCDGIPIQCNTPPLASCTGPNTSRTYSAIGQCGKGTCSYNFTDQNCPAGCNARSGLCENDPCATVSCNASPGKCFADVGSCNAGTCSYEPRPLLAVCDDDNACTTGDSCDGAGACAGAPAPECTDPCAGIVCSTPPSACHQARGTCSDGTCSYAPLALLVPCDDGDACSTEDSCDGNGTCAGTPLSDCEPSGEGGSPAGMGGSSDGGADPIGQGGMDSGSAGAEPTTGATGQGGAARAGGPSMPNAAGETSMSDRASSADPSGCSCRMASSNAGGNAFKSLALLGLLGLLGGLRRRRAG